MPNGGSDNCGTCWFYSKFKGQPGWGHLQEPGPSLCTIRGLHIGSPLYTYCANHRKRNPSHIAVPLGPVFKHWAPDETPGGQEPVYFGERTVWKLSPDTIEIREALLRVVAQSLKDPWPEYPIPPSLAEVAIWQLGELKETRAILVLERLATEGPAVRQGVEFEHLPRLPKAARMALEKITGQREPELRED